jgi:hypothetical protein
MVTPCSYPKIANVARLVRFWYSTTPKNVVTPINLVECYAFRTKPSRDCTAKTGDVRTEIDVTNMNVHLLAFGVAMPDDLADEPLRGI